MKERKEWSEEQKQSRALWEEAEEQRILEKHKRQAKDKELNPEKYKMKQYIAPRFEPLPREYEDKLIEAMEQSMFGTPHPRDAKINGAKIDKMNETMGSPKIYKSLNEMRQEKSMDEIVEQSIANQSEMREPYEKYKDLIFIPNWNNEPIAPPPIVSINGTTFLTQENIGVLVATRGYGKSSICESILSNILNKECDALGFEVGPSVERAIFIDIERTQFDVYNSWKRMVKRTNTKQGENIQDKVLLVGMRKISRINDRKKVIEGLCEEFKPHLLLIDSAKGLVRSIIDEEGARDVCTWFVDLTSKYNLSIITTLHPNKSKGKEETIGGGWIGRILEEECEGLLQVTMDNATGTRTITSTKGRNSDISQTSFIFDRDKELMVRCDKPIKPQSATTRKLPPIIEQITMVEMNGMIDDLGTKEYKHTNLIHLIKQYIQEQLPNVQGSDTRVKQLIIDMRQSKHITVKGKTPLTTYSLRKVGTGFVEQNKMDL